MESSMYYPEVAKSKKPKKGRAVVRKVKKKERKKGRRAVRQAFHIFSVMSPNISLIQPDRISLTSIRTKVRCYFPRPNEVRRIRRHGWQTRMSTPNGRRIIMRRLLKGRYVLSH